MDILVCVKQVPSVSEGRLDRKTGTLLRSDLPAVLNPYDSRALEMALRLRDNVGGTVRVLTMGPASAVAVLREAVAMGADSAILVSDSRFAGADAVATAYTLSQAIRTQPQPDLDTWSEIADLVKGRLRLAGAGSEAAIKLQLRQGEDMLGILHKIFEKYLALRHEQG